MTADQYNAWSAPFRRHPKLKTALVWYNHIVTALIAGCYLGLCAALAILSDARFWRMLSVPATALVFVTLLRAAINRKRPYEALAIDPLIKKNKKGHSFPSRHIFCAFAISVAFFYMHPAAGIVSGILSIGLAISRVIAGIHFPSDVIAGAVLGTVWVALGMYLPFPFFPV